MNIKRRDFLKVAVTGGATLALPAPAEARPNLEVPPNAIGMLYDATLCIGCKACMVGCKDANDMPVESADESPIWDVPTDASGKTLNITAGAATPLLGDATDFGSADLLFATVTNTYVITNDGTVTLTLTPPEITGPAAGDFSITLSPAATVAPGGDTALSIIFDPGDLGIRSANVSIGNNDTDENPFTFAIQGTGTGAATIGVLGGGLEITNGATTSSLNTPKPRSERNPRFMVMWRSPVHCHSHGEFLLNSRVSATT